MILTRKQVEAAKGRRIQGVDVDNLCETIEEAMRLLKCGIHERFWKTCNCQTCQFIRAYEADAAMKGEKGQ